MSFSRPRAIINLTWSSAKIARLSKKNRLTQNETGNSMRRALRLYPLAAVAAAAMAACGGSDSGSGSTPAAVTTELVALMESNGGDLTAAKARLAARIGVTADKLLADHNKETDKTIKATLQAEIDQTIDLIADSVAGGGDIAQALRDGVAKR